MKEVTKGWGRELWLENDEDYCIKFLDFRPNRGCSMHYHLLKKETFIILQGQFRLTVINTEDATERVIWLQPNDHFTISRGMPHQLWTKTGGRILEASTQHFETDSYRIAKGDSQK